MASAISTSGGEGVGGSGVAVAISTSDGCNTVVPRGLRTAFVYGFSKFPVIGSRMKPWRWRRKEVGTLRCD